MSDIHFFTDNQQITGIQPTDHVFGPLSNSGGQERYQIQSKFPITQNAPAYAICKSLLFAVQDENDATLLNIALKPLNTSTAGFPISYFVFRGILKSSLLTTDGKIKLADGTWQSDNILQLIKDLQDKINMEEDTTHQATSNSLGLQFGNSSNTTLIDSVLFDHTSEFHSLIIPAGCQIGKFKGGSSTARIQIVLDVVGAEPTFDFMRDSNSIFTIPVFTPNTGDTAKEQLKKKFQNRFAKEVVINYIDVTAFYGACRNQNIPIEGMTYDDTFLSKFKNKNKVYIDLRDERGFSYNHFFNLDDELSIGNYTGTDNEVGYTLVNYYTGWPILTLSGLTYAAPSKKRFLVEFPILIGSPENLNVLSSYTLGVSSGNSQMNEMHIPLALMKSDGQIQLKKSDPLQFHNWSFSDNKMGSNYFLCKLSALGRELDPEFLSSTFNSFFPIKMKNFFSRNNIPDGEYRIRTYPSLCSPLVIEPKRNSIESQIMGIAYDKFKVTFFSFIDEPAFTLSNLGYQNYTPILGTGIYWKSIDPDESTYNSTTQALGFLHQIVKQSYADNFKLGNFSFTNEQQQTERFLSYVRIDGFRQTDQTIENFNAISFTYAEYDALIDAPDTGFADLDFIGGHKLFIKGKNSNIDHYELLYLQKTQITLGVPKLVSSDGVDFSIGLLDHESDIQAGGQEISVTGAVIKENVN